MYADDICLLASPMQYLLDVCYGYGTDNDIVFNPIKSVILYTLFSNHKLINCTFRLFLLFKKH